MSEITISGGPKALTSAETSPGRSKVNINLNYVER